MTVIHPKGDFNYGEVSLIPRPVMCVLKNRLFPCLHRLQNEMRLVFLFLGNNYARRYENRYEHG